MSFRFKNRAHAGRLLADKLANISSLTNLTVLGLPRGGVPVAFEVARKLQAPLDVFVVRKLGVPHHEELALGAIATGDICFFNESIIESLRIPEHVIDKVIAHEKRELQLRERVLRLGPPLQLCDRTTILIDDGLATGATMRAAVMAVRQREPLKIIVAVPVSAPDVAKAFERHTDEFICLQTPADFEGVGQWYEDFSQTTDEEVRSLLAQAT